MPNNNISLSSRIFYYMMVFIVVESIMIAGVTLFQFNKKNLIASLHDLSLKIRDYDDKAKIKDKKILGLEFFENLLDEYFLKLEDKKI